VVFRTGLMQIAGCLTEGDESQQGSRESMGLCETDDVTRAESKEAGRPSRLRGRAESGGKKIIERVERRKSLAKGKRTFIVVKRRGRRDARSARLNRHTQRTGKTGRLTGSARGLCMRSPVPA
jgi:hypothetical protein